MKVILAAIASLSIVAPHAAHRQHCAKLYTVAQTQRAARAVYAGIRRVPKRGLKVLGYLEMCPRNPAARAYVKWYDHHQAALHQARIDQYRAQQTFAATPTGIVEEAAADYGVPSWVELSVWMHESTQSQNPAGAGSCWFGFVSIPCNPGWPLSTDADMAAALLRSLFDRTGSWSAAMLAYSGGSYSS